LSARQRGTALAEGCVVENQGEETNTIQELRATRAVLKVITAMDNIVYGVLNTI
jgi:hypothetical protein